MRGAFTPGATASRLLGVFRGWVDAEFLADVCELGRVCQPRVGHHGSQGRKTPLGEEQARLPSRRVQTHQPALQQPCRCLRHLGLACLRAAPPCLEKKTLGDAGQRREEYVELTADVEGIASVVM